MPIPFWAVMVIRLPLTEPCIDTSLARPAFRSAAAILPLTAIATVTWSPLLRPAYSACSAIPAGVDRADVDGAHVAWADVAEAGAAALPGFVTRISAQRKITASTNTAPSVMRGPRLVTVPSPDSRAGACVAASLTCTHRARFRG